MLSPYEQGFRDTITKYAQQAYTTAPDFLNKNYTSLLEQGKKKPGVNYEKLNKTPGIVKEVTGTGPTRFNLRDYKQKGLIKRTQMDKASEAYKYGFNDKYAQWNWLNKKVIQPIKGFGKAVSNEFKSGVNDFKDIVLGGQKPIPGKSQRDMTAAEHLNSLPESTNVNRQITSNDPGEQYKAFTAANKLQPAFKSLRPNL